jgi:hypothetical protein
MDNVFTLEVCQRASDPVSPLRIEDVNRVVDGNIFIKAKGVDDVGWDTGV